MAERPTSIYLSAEDRKLMDELLEETKLGRSALIRLALHRMYYGDERERTMRLLAIAEEIKQLA